MSEEGGGGSSKGGAIHSAVGFILFLIVAVYGVQIYLNKPEERPVVACYLPYQGVRLVTVSVPKILLPRDHDIPLEWSVRSAKFNKACVCELASWDLLTDGRRARVPYACK